MKVLAGLTKPWMVALLVAAALAMSLAGRGCSSRLRNAVQPFLTPFGDAGMYLAVALRGGSRSEGLSPREARQLREENQHLLDEANYFRRQWEEARRDLDNVLKLSASFGPAIGTACEIIPARVVAEDSLPYGQTRAVNVGARHGAMSGSAVILTDRSKALPAGLAVVTTAALVGRLVDAGAFAARMQLVTDRDFKVSARIRRLVDPNRPREITIIREGSAAREVLTERNSVPLDVQAVGDGADGLVVSHVPEIDNVLPGDLLVTAGEGLLPVEMRIGRVREVQRDPQHPHHVTLKVDPEADLSSLREVYIVLPIAPPPARAPSGRGR
jgi:cell shape-determining protein MreC